MRLAHILVCHSVSPARLFASIPPREEALWYVFLHGASPEIEAEARGFCEARGGRLFAARRNRGLAISWNDAIVASMADGCEAFLLVNDDLFFYPGGYETFVDRVVAASEQEPDVLFVTSLGRESGTSPLAGQIVPQSFACGAMLRRCIDQLGFFDENFIPAYYEDMDYHARLDRSGGRLLIDERVLVEHERSATSRLLSSRDRRLLEEAHERNRRYMMRKWGSERADGPFQTPFDDPALDLSISLDRRHRPYGERDIIPEVRSAFMYREPA